MKKLFILIALMAFIVNVDAQIFGTGVTKTLAVDYMQGNNNANLGEIILKGTYESLAIQVKMERVSTAAGGTVYLKCGLDSAAVMVSNHSTNPNTIFIPNDTLATTDVATQYWYIEIPNPGAKEYHIWGDGDVDDTVKVTTSYILK